MADLKTVTLSDKRTWRYDPEREAKGWPAWDEVDDAAFGHPWRFRPRLPSPLQADDFRKIADVLDPAPPPQDWRDDPEVMALFRSIRLDDTMTDELDLAKLIDCAVARCASGGQP